VDTTVLVLIFVVVLLVAVVAFGVALTRRKRSERLQEQFGPEYERSVAEAGDRKSAETDLRERQHRHSKLEIRDLHPEEQESSRSPGTRSNVASSTTRSRRCATLTGWSSR